MSKIMTMTFTCRICLTKNDLLKKTKMLSKKLVQRIEDLSGIKLKLQDDYPNRICVDCLEMLDISTKFRDMCRASEHAWLALAFKPVLKTEPLDSFEQGDDDSITIKSDNDTNFFGNFVECQAVESISEIADFSMDGLDVQVKQNNENESSNENIETIKSEPKPTMLSNEEQMPTLKVEPKDETITGKQRQKFPSNKGRKRAEDTGGSYSIMCEICGNIYKQRNLLNMHMRRHLEYKPYDCEICAKSFACASEIRRHMRTHTGEKPYICNFCGRTFADRSTNIKHERTHTNTRPFQCTTCGKSFTYSNVLKNHMLTHTGEKNFPCLPCNKTFSRKHQLDQHCATITHQQTIKCLANADENQLAVQSDIILDNRIIVQPLLLIPKINEEVVLS